MNLSRLSNLKTKPKILIGICAPMILLLVLGGVSITSINGIVETDKWVGHTHNVLAESAGIVSSAVDMETGMRGYLLAGKEEFLDPYKNGEQATYDALATLRETVSDNPGQVNRLSEAEQIIRDWQEKVTEPTIALRREIGDAKTMNDMASLVGEARGKVYFDKFREQISTFTAREVELLDKRHKNFVAAEKAVAKSYADVKDATKWVDHTHKVLASAAQRLAEAVDMETGMRGYMLSGQEEFLEPYLAGKTNFFDGVATLQKTVSDNAPQVERLQNASDTIQTWVDEVVEPAFALRRQVNEGSAPLSAIQDLISRKLGKQHFDKFRAIIAEFSEIESSLMAKRYGATDAANTQVRENLEAMSKNEEWVGHTYKVIGKANAILASAVDMETGMRGYLLAGQDEFLAPYLGGSDRFTAQVAELSEIVSDNPAQVALLADIAKTIGDWRSNVTEPTIALRREIGDAKTMDDMADLVGEARGKQFFDGFRQVMADFQAEESGLMAARIADKESTVTNTFTMIGLCIAIAIAIGLALAWLIGNGIAGPIARMTGAMRQLADGDLTVEVPATERRDEIGQMAGAVQVFKDNGIEQKRMEEANRTEQQAREARQERIEDLTRRFDETVTGSLATVSSAATEMQSSAESMASTSDETNRQSQSAAAASTQAASNVQAVSAAAEQMSASITEITRQVATSAEKARAAVEEVRRTNATVEGLSEGADRIGEVVGIISDIANQTNLLALNATIEAARAGEAGKGFAVVASEVKNLASQTAKATDDIAAQINAIQTSTRESVSAIEGIGRQIAEMEEVSAAVASAIEEQDAATREISSNSQSASQGTQEVSRNIASVTEAAAEAGMSANNVLGATGELAQQAELLRGEVDNFLASVRAA